MANYAKLIHADGTSTLYASLFTNNPSAPGAIDDAVTGETVEVLEDITFSTVGTAGQKSSIYIYDKGITLDLCGHTLTFDSAPTSDSDKKTAIEIKSSSSVINETVIKNGNIVVQNGGNGVYVDTHSTVTFEDVSIDQSGYVEGVNFYRAAAITGASGANTATIIINSGTYSSQHIAVIAKKDSNLIINGGTFYSKDVTPNQQTELVIEAEYFCKAINSYMAKTTINGGTFGQGRTDDIAVGSYLLADNDVVINGGTFDGAVYDGYCKTLVNDGTFNDTIKVPVTTPAGHLTLYTLEGGSYVDDVATIKNGDGSAMVTDTNLIVSKLGSKYRVIEKPDQPGDEYKYLSGEGLATLWSLIKERATVESGIATDVSETDTGGKKVDVVVDDATVVVDDANKLSVPFDDRTLIINSDNDIAVPLDERTITVNSEGKVSLPIDEYNIIINSEGKITTGFDGILIAQYGVTPFDDVDIAFRKNKYVVCFDNKDLFLLNNVEIDHGDITYIFHNLTLTDAPAGEKATTVLHTLDNISGWKSKSIFAYQALLSIDENTSGLFESGVDPETLKQILYVRKDDRAIKLNDAHELFVPFDEETIVFNSEGEVSITPISEEDIKAIWNSLI